ncbi:Blp family class II bacteriocin [Streptococcus cristatus]|uniref:Blp family class II bacteriocin n=1 Tax=Streptococcus cristatus TaxID=45634 RepID=UPI0028D90FC5|nr:Blp family class II bacteriocin [Streptococcus cristatus]
MDTKVMSQFEVMDENMLATVEGGFTGVLESIGIGIGIGWAIYQFGEAAGRAYYYATHP